MNHEDLTTRVRVFAEERDWQGFHTPKNLAMALAGEVGELVAEFQWLTPEESVTVMAADAGARVRAEIGDVMIYLTRLADVLGIDLVAAASDKLDDSARRYPADRVRGSAAKETDYLLRNPNNAAVLRRSIAELGRGDAREHDLIDTDAESDIA